MRIQPLVLVFLLAAGLASAGDEPVHRLAGIVEVEGGARQAWIATSGGEERVFRVGDALGDGRITEIAKRSVRVAFPDHELVLQLAGDAAEDDSVRAGDSALVVESRSMSAQALRRLLRRQSSPTDRLSPQSGQTTPVITSPESRQNADVKSTLDGSAPTPDSMDRSLSDRDSEVLRQELNAALGLPTEARVIAVDETRLSAPAALAEELAQALERGEVPRLTLEKAGGVDEIYVIPEDMPQGSTD